MLWERAERLGVHVFVEFLCETPNPQRLRRRPDASAPGSGPHTGKPALGRHYASRMINHAEDRRVEAREKVWLGEVAAVEESLTHLRRRAEADSPLTRPDSLDNITG